MAKVWLSFAFGRGLHVLQPIQIFGVSRLLFGKHDSFTGIDVDTCVLHNFALFVQRFL